MAESVRPSAVLAKGPHPNCADVLPNVFQWPGLLPIGVPLSWGPNFVTIWRRSSGNSAAIPFIVDGDPLVLEPAIRDGKLVVSRPTGTERQRLEVRRIDLPPDPEDRKRPLSSPSLQAAVGERSIVVAASTYPGVVLLVIDKKTWKVRRMKRLQADASGNYKLVHAYLAAGGGLFGVAVTGEKRPFASAESWKWMFERFDEDGIPRGKRQFFDTSSYIEPRVVWTGNSFAVLAGRAGDFGPVSLGIYTMAAKDGGAATYMGWLEAPGDHDLRIGGTLLWHDGNFHVAMRSSRRGARDDVAQIVHADPAGHVRIERCPNVKLRDE